MVHHLLRPHRMSSYCFIKIYTMKNFIIILFLIFQTQTYAQDYNMLINSLDDEFNLIGESTCCTGANNCCFFIK